MAVDIDREGQQLRTVLLYLKCPADINPCDSLKGILIAQCVILQLTYLHFNLHFCVKKIRPIMAK